MQKMKILEMSRWFYPHYGGASVVVYNVTKNLVKDGHEVHLLTHNPKTIKQCNTNEEAPWYEEREGFKVYRMPYYKHLGAAGNWAASIPLMAKKAVKIIKKEKIDVILCHDPPYLVGAAAYNASILTGVPVVNYIHDIWGASHYSSIENKVGYFLEGFCIKRFKRNIILSEGTDAILKKRYDLRGTKFYLAPTGVDTEKFKPIKLSKSDSEGIIKRLEKCGLDKDLLGKIKAGKANKMLFLGIIAPWSGCQYLIEASKGILERNPDSVFIIIGHGVLYDNLMKRAKELGVFGNIAFMGTVPHEEIPDLLNFADFCIAPFPKFETVGRESKTPSRPVSVLEFLASGKPVLTSNHSGIDRLVKDGKNGMLFEAENVSDLAEKANLMITDKKALARMGKFARESTSDYGWGKSVKIIERALEDAMKEGSFRKN